MTDAAQTFRISLVRLWFAAAILHGAFTVLVVGCVALAGRQVNWLYVMLFAFAPALWWVVYGLKFRVTVSPEGLGWTTIDGADAFASWDDIGGGHTEKFLFLPLLEIEYTGGRGRSATLLILSDVAGFGDALREHAGAEHPLTRAVTGDVG